jgi:hypothetical protein
MECQSVPAMILFRLSFRVAVPREPILASEPLVFH